MAAVAERRQPHLRKAVNLRAIGGESAGGGRAVADELAVRDRYKPPRVGSAAVCQGFVAAEGAALEERDALGRRRGERSAEAGAVIDEAHAARCEVWACSTNRRLAQSGCVVGVTRSYVAVTKPGVVLTGDVGGRVALDVHRAAVGDRGLAVIRVSEQS